MQKRKPGQPHRGWKAAARKARRPKPVRIQRKRTKGWKMPPNTVYVGRPSVFGNSVRIGPDEGQARTAEQAVAKFKYQCEVAPGYRAAIVARLRGKNLACWCRLDQPCHADVLLKIANEPIADRPWLGQRGSYNR